MGLWIVVVASLLIGAHSILWPFSPAAVRLAQYQAGETVWKALGVGAFLTLPLLAVGWIWWGVETGDARYFILGLVPVGAQLISMPVRLWRHRQARREMAL